MNPRVLLSIGRYWLGNIVEAVIGTRMRQIGSLIAILVIVFVWVNIGDDTLTGEPGPEELQRAINLAHHFENENRGLKQESETEQRLRRVADQTITALSEQIKEQDEQILNQEQQLAFYRQLLEERGNPEDEIQIRTFEIVPDYRENHYQLLAVLVRGGAEIDTFEGMLELALSLRNSNGDEFEHRPLFDIGSLDTEFRYYHEVQAVFPIPQGTEILNGQLALFRGDGELMASRILVDQVL